MSWFHQWQVPELQTLHILQGEAGGIERGPIGVEQRPVGGENTHEGKQVIEDAMLEIVIAQGCKR